MKSLSLFFLILLSSLILGCDLETTTDASLDSISSCEGEDCEETSSACEESGSENCEDSITTSSLELNIKSASPVQGVSSQGDCLGSGGGLSTSTVSSTSYCFDISGDCNEGDNDSAYILLRSSTFSALTIIKTNQTILGECKRGRFQIQFQVEYDTSNLTDICKIQTLSLELVGKKLNNEEETNPTKAKKFVDLQVKDSEGACP